MVKLPTSSRARPNYSSRDRGLFYELLSGSEREPPPIAMFEQICGFYVRGVCPAAELTSKLVMLIITHNSFTSNLNIWATAKPNGLQNSQGLVPRA